MTSGQEKWETVVNKKKSHVTKSDARKAQQKLLENASNSTLDIRNPLEQSATIYDAFDGIKKEPGKKRRPLDNDYERPGQTDPSESVYASRNGHSRQQPGKGGQGKKKPTKLHQIEIDEMQEKLGKLDFKVLGKTITQTKTQFPNYPLIWLKDVAAWLHLQLAGPAETDVALTSYPRGFPGSSLTSKVKGTLETLVCEVQPSVIELLLTHCVTSMFAELQQGKGSMGFRVLLQIIANKRQDVLILKMPEVLANKTFTQKAYLSVMWLYSQCQNNVTDGIQVWKSAMQPALYARSHAPVAINYLESLINLHKNNTFAKAVLSPADLLEFIQLAHSSKSPLHSMPQLKNQMEDLLTHLERLALSDKPETIALAVFKTFLGYLSDEDKAVRDKVSEILVFCWSANKECGKTFEESFSSNYARSSVLLSYICKRQAAVSKQLAGGGWYSKEDVLKTLASRLLSVLEEHRRMGEGSKSGFADCVNYCKQLVASDAKPSRSQAKGPRHSGSSWKWFLFKWTVYILLLSVAVDIYRSQRFEASTTYRVLKRYSLDQHALKVVKCIDKKTTAATSWIRENGPYYYGKIEIYVGPVVDATVTYTKLAWEFVREKSKPAVNYIYETTPVVLAKIDEFIPGFTDTLTNLPMDIQLVYLPKAYEYLSDFLLALFNFFQVASTRIRTTFVWSMHEIYKLSPSTFDTFEEYAILGWAKVVEYSPIVCDRMAEMAVQTKDTALHCVNVGQNWLSTHVLSSRT